MQLVGVQITDVSEKTSVFGRLTTYLSPYQLSNTYEPARYRVSGQPHPVLIARTENLFHENLPGSMSIVAHRSPA